MKEILITEIFASIQGEGARVGHPSIFIRTFGCNLQCRAFGQPDLDNLLPINEMPHNKFDPSNITDINDLPVFGIGCDSSAAWNKKYRHLAKSYTVDDLIKRIDSIIPDRIEQPYDIVITGGEPLLKKNQSFWVDFFLNVSVLDDINSITFETNGTQPITKEFKDAFSFSKVPIIFSVSPKLSNSGEKFEKACNPEAISSILNLVLWHDAKIYFKFVVRNEDQLVEIDKFIESYSLVNDIANDIPVYLMPEGGTLEGLELTEQEVCKLAMEYGYNYSPRLHIQLFGNRWGT